MERGQHLRILRNSRDLLATGIGWSLMACIGLLAMRNGYLPTIWFAEAVTVAAFLETRWRRWPVLIAFLLPWRFLTFMVAGEGFTNAALWTFTGLFEAITCALITTWVLGGHGKVPRSLLHLFGLFASGFLAVGVGSLATRLVLPPVDPEALRWWYTAKVLGLLSIVQIIRFLLRQIRAGKTIADLAGHWQFFAWLPVAAGVAWIGMTVHWMALPLMVSGVVFGTMRFGAIFTPAMVLSIAFTALGVKVLGPGITPTLGEEEVEALFALQAVMIVMLATALPVSAIMRRRDELDRQLITRNARLHENITILGLAEQLAGIGRYRIDLKGGGQDWSPSMLELHGLPRELAPDPGDLSTILPETSERLFAEVEAHRDEKLPYSFDYHAKPPQGPERILRMSILNEFDMEGERTAIFGVAIDVTEQIRREEALDLARGRAVRLAAEAQKIANTDALTELPNRRCTFARLKSMVETAALSERPLAAIMFDIDHFKQVNDRHGHQAGDEVLVRVAQLARNQTRSGDLIGRIGGEEFVWLLPDVPAREVGRLAERLRSAIEKGTRGFDHPHVTASIGMAMYRSGDTEESLLARADAALYDAKESGRNQVKRAA